ncbi:MAG TPA: hypothetical protein VJ506_08360 [Candidatus Limnocylindrales bacterium]|nr:hypothetical protein [Candidatus Limnocylindrales bacterium]
MADWSPEPDSQPFVPVAPEPESPATVPTQPVSPTATQVGTSRMRGVGWVNAALALAIAVAIGGIGFAAGRMTAPASTSSAAGANGAGRLFGDRNGQLPGGYFPGGFPGGFNDDGGFRGILGAGGASLEGTVQSISGDTLTLRLASGQTIQVSLSGTTTYHSQAAASASDVKSGGTVIVRVQVSRGGGQATTGASATDVTIVP